MPKITAIIHLVKKGRTCSSRYGKFLRPDKPPHPDATDLHLWEGRELSVEEFNTLLPVAIRSVLTTDTVYGRILVRPDEGTATAPSSEEIEKLKNEHVEAVAALEAKHADALKAVQEGVNEFTEKHNRNLEEARKRIAELEAMIPMSDEKPKAADEAVDEATQPLSEGNLVTSQDNPLVEAAPPGAGERPEDAAEPDATTEAAEKAVKEAKKAAAKEAKKAAAKEAKT